MKLTENDFKQFEDIMEQVLGRKLDEKLKPLRDDIKKNTDLTDRYLKKTEDWHQEQQVLVAQYRRLKEVLVEKGIATEKELSLLGS